MFFSWSVRSAAEIGTVCVIGTTPTSTVVPPRPGHGDGLLHGGHQADALEDEVGAAAGELCTAATGSPSVASMQSVAPSFWARSNFQDWASMAMILPGADDAGALERRQPHAAAADDHDARAGRDVHRVERGAEPGGDPAADQRGPVEGHVVADLHQRALGAEHLLGEGRQVRELGIGSAVPSVAEPRLRPSGRPANWERHRYGRPSCRTCRRRTRR